MVLILIIVYVYDDVRIRFSMKGVKFLWFNAENIQNQKNVGLSASSSPYCK